jgi:beta-mannosidase
MTIEAWAWSARAPLADGCMEVRAFGLDGAVLASASRSVALDAGRPTAGPRLEVPAVDGLAILDLALRDADGRTVAVNRYVLAGGDDLGPLLDLPSATVDVGVARDPGADAWDLAISHVRGPAALGLVLDDDRPIEDPGWAEASDGWFDLLPGESRTVRVRWVDGPPDGRRLRLHGWNVDVPVA